MPLTPPSRAGFDHFASDYDTALQQGLAVSGEDKLFFARGRIAWLAHCLHEQRFQPQTALDFGCGTGTSVPFLYEFLRVRSVVGVDVSRQSIAVAERLHGSPQTRFIHVDEYVPDQGADVVFCNGVFHHIPPAERHTALRCVWEALRPGGLFALWENNPFNPGTRYVMSKIPFDRDAITLTAGETRWLLQAAGFRLLRTDYLFIFPRLLKVLRCLEPYLSGWPLGAQYQVLAQK